MSEIKPRLTVQPQKVGQLKKSLNFELKSKFNTMLVRRGAVPRLTRGTKYAVRAKRHSKCVRGACKAIVSSSETPTAI